MATLKRQVAERNTVCGKLGCDFVMWGLHQAGVCFSRESGPRRHAGVWLNQLSHKLAALRLIPEGGTATWTWSADQSLLLSPSCAGN